MEHGSPGGLLGHAVYGVGRLYACSTAADGNRIQRFTVTGTPGSLALGDAETILDQIADAISPKRRTDGFGPDGMIYVTVCDAGQTDRAREVARAA